MLLIMLVYDDSGASTPEPYQHIQASEHNVGAPDILNSTENISSHTKLNFRIKQFQEKEEEEEGKKTL